MVLEDLHKESVQLAQTEKVRAAQAILKAEIVKIRSGDDWQRYLAFAAELHSYTPNNAQLIIAQHAMAYQQGRVPDPNPGFVAGFHTWKALGRQVERGQKGYAILAPIRYSRRVASSPDGQVRVLRHDELPGPSEHETMAMTLGGFKIEHVFSQFQTSGDPLPEVASPKLLNGMAPVGLGEAIMHLAIERGYAVETVGSAVELGGANGMTDVTAHTIRIRDDMDDAAMVKTMIHEVAHVLLHTEGLGAALERSRQEVEAESTAFIVAAAHGMASDDYSFPCIAAWAGADPVKAIAQTQARVSSAARLILEASPAPKTPGGRVPGVEEAIERKSNERAVGAPQNERFVASYGVDREYLANS
ncbi:DUF6782 family putative metallopeptidase [Ferrimicrobium sp.]|uniref:DUF6782 family putative metallopeptidase n=1 Tax=Ferrimicrobium sp. TaxID=2926050 RepID=UPI00261CE3C1|nr:DUF6782 family putative metallopeptidase [Ferrimicrobium sp.]